MFNLQISAINGRSVEVDGFGGIDIMEDYTNDKSFFIGTKKTSNLSFRVEANYIEGHNQFLESYQLEGIHEWLFYHNEPKWFSILDENMVAYSYLAILSDPKLLDENQQKRGISFTVHCNSSYSFTDIIEKTYICSEFSQNIMFYNLSNVREYLYPTLEIQLTNDSNYVEILNKSDSDRIFLLKGLVPNDKIFVDNELCYMESANDANILSKFNFRWFRAVIGVNEIEVKGKCIIKLTTRFKKAIGGY